MCLPCCWPFADVWLEDAPKKEKQEQRVYVPYGYAAYPLLRASATPSTAPPAAPTNPPLHTYNYIPAGGEPAQPPQVSVYGYPAYAYEYYPQFTYYPQYPQQYVYATAPAPAPKAPEPQPHTYQYFSPYATYQTPAYAYPAAVNNANSNQHVWFGRTKAQVDEDNMKIALREGVFRPNEMVPRTAGDDQMFWVRELDGSNTLRTLKAIESSCKPGKWHTDPNNGNAYFVRERG
ncbi:hypothetical protein LTR60_002479 [Cryomyces antarcticus]|nr:hypothetical protein LTR39_002524 [Cryomyces antarcticus]KAK5016277.1 hypothetical protein LTR60_002479 [Cryomyces antarcticus]